MISRTFEKRYLNTKELAEYLSMGINSAPAFGKAVGAHRWIGRRLVFDRKVIDRAADSFGSGEDLMEVIKDGQST